MDIKKLERASNSLNVNLSILELMTKLTRQFVRVFLYFALTHQNRVSKEYMTNSYASINQHTVTK